MTGIPEDGLLYTPMWVCTVCGSVLQSKTAKNAGWISNRMAHEGYNNVQDAESKILYLPHREPAMVQKSTKSVV
jgi:hypothetical protein